MSMSTDNPTDLAALQAKALEAETRLEAIESEEQRLSLDALSDKRAAKELGEVQAQRAACENTIRQMRFAAQEHGRREAAQLAAEERARVEAARLEALELQAARVAAAEEVDEGCAQLARALSQYGDLVSRQTLLLVAAGLKQLHVEEGGTQRALFAAMIEAQTPAGLVNWPGFHMMGAAPFAGLDPVPIYPNASEAPEPDAEPELVGASAE
jgi:hypothetical protein